MRPGKQVVWAARGRASRRAVRHAEVTAVARGHRTAAGNAAVEAAIVGAAVAAALMGGPAALPARFLAALDVAIGRVVAAVGTPLP